MQHQQQSGYAVAMEQEAPLATEETTKQLLRSVQASAETMKHLQQTMKHVEWRQAEVDEPNSMEQRKVMADSGTSDGHKERSLHEADVESAMFDAYVTIDQKRYGYDHKVTIIIVIVCVVCFVCRMFVVLFLLS